MISYPRLKELLDYDPVEGVFRWAVSRGFKKQGMKATCGRITLDGKVYEAGKLAWFYTHCRWPGRNFTYLNDNKTDIRLGNLTDRKPKAPKRVIDFWIRMTRVETGYRLELTQKYKASVDLGIYSTYAEAAEVQRWALECSQ